MGGNEGKHSLVSWHEQKEHLRHGGGADIVGWNITYSKHHEDDPSRKGHRTPRPPGVTAIHLLPFDLPAAELFVQPPPIRTVAQLDVRKPFCYDGYYCCVEPNANT